MLERPLFGTEKFPKYFFLILLLIMLYLASNIFATTCAYTADVWPRNGSTIPLNAQFAVTNAELPSNARPMLSGLTGSIPLAIGTYYGTSPYPSRNTTWLIPTQELTPQTRYELRFQNPKVFRHWQYERIGVPVGDINHREWEPFHWTTSKYKDIEPPTWFGRPVIIDAKSWTGFSSDGSEITIQMPIFEENCIALIDLIAEKRYLIQAVVPIVNHAVRLRTGLC